MIAGTDLCEGLAVLAGDEDTKAIILIGEIGGAGEVDAAQWIAEYSSRESEPK
jgi:succinyl-CoA synthetase alpha subunit